MTAVSGPAPAPSATTAEGPGGPLATDFGSSWEGRLLFWIAVKLLLPESEGEGGGKASASMASAVKTILIADLVMSLDNVIAVAAAAKGSLLLLIAGLAISIPLVIFGSTLLLGLMERFPVIITIGAALLGWVAGEMLISDPVVKDWVDANAAWTPKHALHMIDVLLDYDVEIVEQPVAAHDIDGLRFVRERSPLRCPSQRRAPAPRQERPPRAATTPEASRGSRSAYR